jgi:hypothetical protein
MQSYEDTIRAPNEEAKTGENIPGTVGFDIYLASIGCGREAIRAPRVPSFEHYNKGMGHAL